MSSAAATPGVLASLRHYWRPHAAVAMATAITTAVLVGSLFVGDSMRGSLRGLVTERLGDIESVLVGDRFFRAGLLDELRGVAGAAAMDAEPVALAPAILLRGAATVPESGSRASSVDIIGVDESFFDFYDESSPPGFDRADGQLFASVILNQSLAGELGAEVGDDLLLTLSRPSDVPRESLLGSTDSSDLVQTLRVSVREVVPDRGVGRFGLEPHQSLPLNAFVKLNDVQRALDQRGQVNAVLMAGVDPGTMAAELREVMAPEDFGLELSSENGSIVVRSREIMLRPQMEQRLLDWASSLGVQGMPVSTYLANQVTAESGTSFPYSTITAFDPSVARDFGELIVARGESAGTPFVLPLGADEVLVNRWAADDLQIEAGSSVEVAYWEVGQQEQLIAREITLTVREIVEMSGLGADRGLTPEFPGVHDADDMSDWEPTFPVDLAQIRDLDEEYWDLYGAAPKLFVSPDLGRQLWGSERFGTLTSLHLRSENLDAGELEDQLARSLPEILDLRTAGLDVLPVREQGLQASKGATEFAGLFFGFSLFLIVSAVLLASLFFRLGTEQRASEIGLRLATGHPLGRVQRTLALEGGLVAGVGVLVGLALAALYAWVMVWALQTVWIGAIGSRFLTLHLGALSMIGGGLGSLLLVVLVIWRSARSLARAPVIGLLRGVTRSGESRSTRRGSWAGRFALGSGVLALLLMIASVVVSQQQAAPIFMGLGMMLLVLGLSLFSMRLGSPRDDVITRGGPLGLLRMAVKSTSLNQGRSLLSAALVSSACFVIVAVGAYGHRFGEELRDKSSGAGGFWFHASSEIPLFFDLGTEEGRFELGLAAETEALLEGAEVFSMRFLPGDDVSCLNLYQPQKPRLLGVQEEFIARGGFAFQGAVEDRENPWSLLDDDLGADVIPAIGDANSVMWILKSGLGKDVEMTNERGEPIRIRLVGLLSRSIFRSELLIAEDRLIEHFPSRAGYQQFLIAPAVEQEEGIAEALETDLARFGVDVTTTAQRLESYQAVENTYLGTFQALGGLGLVLGTFGLAVIVLRNIIERSSELAAMRAMGFKRRTLGWMVLAENSVLLAAGVLIGAASALVAVAPHLRGGQALVPWSSLIATLALVLIFGTSASLAALRQALRAPLLPALRN